MFQTVNQVTLRSSLRALGYRLWDEEHKRLVGFNYLRTYLSRPSLPSA